MGKKVMSARGKIVDFDLLKIKQQMLKTPKNENVKTRERFIDKRRRRIGRSSIDQLLRQKAPVASAEQKVNSVETVAPTPRVEHKPAHIVKKKAE